MSRSPASLAVCVTLTALLPLSAMAQGFAVNEHGTCVMARSGTGVASPCGDGSTILFNPSGIAGMTGITVSAGVTGIQALGSFTDDLLGREDELQADFQPVPHAYVVYGINEKLAAGLGFFVPYGLGTEWDSTSFEGRFNGYNNDLRSIYFQPTVAYQPDPRIKVGAGFNVVVGSVKLRQRLDLSEFEIRPDTTFGQLGIPFHTDFADAKITASGAFGIGGNFGITVIPADWVTFGARYMTRVKLTYDGEADFEPVPTNIVLPPGNPLSLALGLDPSTPLPLDLVLAGANLFEPDSALGDQGGETSITMPDQIVAGFAVNLTPSVMFLFDWQWIRWSVFDEIELLFDNAATPDRVIEENYRDTHGLRWGLDFAASDRLNVRGGFLHHRGAAPDETVTPLLPEGTRNEVTGGFGYRITDQITVDVAYQYLKQNDRRGRVREPPAGQSPTTDLNSGLYSFRGHLFGLTLSAHF